MGWGDGLVDEDACPISMRTWVLIPTIHPPKMPACNTNTVLEEWGGSRAPWTVSHAKMVCYQVSRRSYLKEKRRN